MKPAILNRRTLVPILVSTAVLAACQRSTTEPDEHADRVDVIRLRVTVTGQAEQTVDITRSGAQAGITLPVNLAAAVTAEFLDDDGDPVDLHDDEFELRVVPQNASLLTFTRTGAFGGTLTGLTAGEVTLAAVSVFHLDEGHDDFGPFNVGVTIVQ